MTKKRNVSGAVASEYCTKHKSVSTRTLANMMYRDNPTLFKSWESARSAIRYCRGEIGKYNRTKATSIDETTKKDRIEIPESHAKPILPYELKARGNGIVISDVHIPYHDKRALEIALEYADKINHNAFCIINGDFVDCYQLSKFVKDPRERSFAEEIEDTQTILRCLKQQFKTVIYKLGNHERRYSNYLRVKAPELLGIEDMEWERIFKLEEIGIEFVDHVQVIHAGPLTILHGHEHGSSVFSPVNPARGMFLRSHACTLSAHLHRTSQHNEPDIRRQLTTCWSTGCLCDLRPEYAPLNKWDHGLAELRFDGEWFEIDTKRIVKGKVV